MFKACFPFPGRARNGGDIKCALGLFIYSCSLPSKGFRPIIPDT